MKAHLLLVLLAACTFTPTTSAQTAPDIIAKNIEVRGGAEKFREIHSMMIRTHEQASWGGAGTATLRIMRPNLLRFDYVWQANAKVKPNTIITGFDGKTGWHAEIMDGKQKRPTAFTGDQLEALRQIAENQFDESVTDPQATPNEIRLLGTEMVQGRPCYKVRFTNFSTRSASQVTYEYYDANSFLQLQYDQVVPLRGGKEKLLTTIVSDYRMVDGIVFPYTFISMADTSPFASVRALPLPELFFTRNKTTSTIEVIEINPTID